MSSTTIPEKTIKNCDVCGIEITRASAMHQARLILKRSAVDWNNVPCADASISFDLCDTCHDDISEAINAAAELIRHGKAARDES